MIRLNRTGRNRWVLLVTIELFSRRRLVRGPLWYFRIVARNGETVARNGETVAQSEGYSRRIDCMNTAHRLKDELGKARVVDA
jgi:uncharacterized protein YegP (UPF0339 family)